MRGAERDSKCCLRLAMVLVGSVLILLNGLESSSPSSLFDGFASSASSLPFFVGPSVVAVVSASVVVLLAVLDVSSSFSLLFVGSSFNEEEEDEE